tara:strand:- start:235 stop:879 length:645 start_codon:yes stop_codon:yes gene_type:complete
MAYEFDGINQYISAANPVSDTPITLACWFNSQDDINNNILLYVGSPTTTQRCTLSAAGNLAGDPVRVFSAGNLTTNGANTSTGWTVNTWNHACGVFSSNSSRAVYLNGGGKVSTTANVGPPSSAWTEMAISSQIASSSRTSYFDGLIAEAGIWNAALTDNEVASLAKGMTCNLVRPQSLVFYAPLIRNLQDVRRGLTLTNNNTAIVANHPRVYR